MPINGEKKKIGEDFGVRGEMEIDRPWQRRPPEEEVMGGHGDDEMMKDVLWSVCVLSNCIVTLIKCCVK